MRIAPLPLPQVGHANGNGTSRSRTCAPPAPWRLKHYDAQANIHDLIVLSQVRGDSAAEYDMVQNLSVSIDGWGLMHQIMIADWDVKGMKSYLKLVQDVFEQEVSIEDYKPYTEPGKPKRYLVVLAGHRRLTAIRGLETEGCPNWHKHIAKHPKVTIRDLFEEVFPGGYVKVMVYPDINAFKALKTQLQENLTQHSVPTPRLARTIYRLHRATLIEEGRVNLPAFADDLGVPLSSIRQYLGFCDLPLVVQEMIEGGMLNMVAGYELSRFRRRLLTEGTRLAEDKADEATRSMASEFTVMFKAHGKNKGRKHLISKDALREIADKKANELVHGQKPLYEELVLTPAQEVSRRVNETHVKEAMTLNEILKHVDFLRGQQLVEKGAPYQTKMSRELVQVLLRTFSTYKDQLAALMDDGQKAFMEDILNGTHDNLRAVNEVAPLLFSR